MDLPVCRWRGAATATHATCHSPRMASPLVSLNVCNGKAWGLPACKYADLDASPEFPVREDVHGPPPINTRCQFRGPELRTVACKPCRNLGEKIAPIFSCQLHRECAFRPGILADGMTGSPVRACLTCEDYRERPIAPAPQVGGFLVNAKGESGDALANTYQGASCFLVCGGPSLNQTPLELLNNRGILVAAVNQAGATHVRPDLWFSVDDPAHFHAAIWSDPHVMKFARIDQASKSIVQRSGERFTPTGQTANRSPNTWFFRPTKGIRPTQFLAEKRIVWGGTANLDGKSLEKRSVMLVALRLLFWLGVRTVYLVGADFRMTPESTYAFDDPKDRHACGTNNNTYRILDGWFSQLRPTFEDHGFHVLNATPGSHLTAFDRIDFRAAVARVTQQFPKVETVKGHYRARA